MGKVYCEFCKRRCRGTTVKVNQNFYHRDCFTCSECKCKLYTGGYFIKNDKYYCQKDYLKSLTPKCSACGEILDGNIISALSYSFHTECFACCKCRTPFDPRSRITVWRDEFYCICCSRSIITVRREMGIGDSGDDGDDGAKSPLLLVQLRPPQHRLSFVDQTSPVSVESMDCWDTAATHKTNQNGGILKPSLGESATMPTFIRSTSTGDDPDRENRARIMQGFAPHPLAGRFYNLSYASIDEQACRRSTDAYRRGGLHNLTASTSASHPQHFHIPQGSRFSIEPNRIIPAGMSRTSRSFNSYLRDVLLQTNEPVVRKVVSVSSPCATTTTTATADHHLFSSSSQLTDEDDTKKNSTLAESKATGLEARRLATFPSAQPPDESSVPAIERYDWPAPAAIAVLTAEMMRERRQRLREQGVLPDGSEESIGDLSTDISLGSHSESERASSGIARAIQLEEEWARRHRTRTPHNRDLISASRTPSAKVEPSFKTRFATHSFTGHAESLRQRYTNGTPFQLSCPPGKNCTSPPRTCVSSKGGDVYGSIKDQNGPGSTAFQHLPVRAENGFGTNVGDAVDFHQDFTCYPDHANVLCSSTPCAASKRLEEFPVKKIAYKDLMVSTGQSPLKTIDRCRLETYLSNDEFEDVFKMSRTAFYQLPEWKRNDLKRQADLF